MPMRTGDADSSNIHSNVPAFLVKLWKLVEDPQYDDHISWNKNGSGFLVHDQATFAREILPKYFKHNNFASFVRQLNMYGFRKVIGAEQGGLRSEKDEWEFFNGNFNRYHPELLENVKRKAAPEEKKVKTEDVSKVLNDVQDMKGKQDEMTMKLDQIKRENVTLWNELVELRQKHQRQQQIVNKLFQYLMRLIYQNDKLVQNRKRLMLQDSTEEPSSKRERYDYRDGSGPSSGQPPPSYSAQRPSTQTLTISDISNVPATSLPSTSGPLITSLDDDTISHARPVIRFPEDSGPSTSQPIVSSPVSTSSASSYPQASVVQPCVSTGVVTFPEEQNQTPIVHPTHIIEPQSYDEHHTIRNAPMRRGLSQEELAESQNPSVDIFGKLSEDDMVERNFIGDQVDFISSNLDNIQYQLANHPLMLDNSLFYDVFGHEGGHPTQVSHDPLDVLADRAAASPLPGTVNPSQGNELVQYGMQASGASSNSPRGPPRSRERMDQYGRREWSPGQQQQSQQSEYDVVHHIFNG